MSDKPSVTRPQFTTSASAHQEKKAEERPKEGWAKTVTPNSQPQSRSRPLTRPCPPHEPLTHEPAFTHLRKPKTDKQKRMLWH